jgi:HEAT repeat protein
MKVRSVVTVAVFFAAISLVALAFLSADHSEPTYQGKRLSAWLDERHPTPPGPVVLNDDAVAAVQALGSEAIPTLLAWLRASDSWMSRNAKIVLEWRLSLPVQVPTNQAKRMRAMYGFRALGAAAKSAFPEIVALVLNSPDEWQRGDAINALTDSDADTMRRLAEGLNSPSTEVRLRAVNALTCLRIEPDEVCLPALERATSDPDTRVRSKAAQGIALINSQLTVIAGWLTHHDPEYREIAARIVGGYRARARSYLPALEVAAHDPDLKVRAAASGAIEQIRGRY